MRSLILSLTIAAGLVVGIVSPNMGCDKADAAFDCAKVCDKYKECLGGADYDSSACASRCRDDADTEAFRDKADMCETCVDDKSCLAGTFACATECVGIRF